MDSLADPIQDDSIRALLWSEIRRDRSEAGRSVEFQDRFLDTQAG